LRWQRAWGGTLTDFGALCIRCGACVHVCPTQGLQPSLFEGGVQDFSTPRLVPRLGNALSTCAFIFVIFGQDGRGVALDESDLLVRTLACYGIETAREELEWFAEAF